MSVLCNPQSGGGNNKINVGNTSVEITDSDIKQGSILKSVKKNINSLQSVSYDDKLNLRKLTVKLPNGKWVSNRSYKLQLYDTDRSTVISTIYTSGVFFFIDKNSYVYYFKNKVLYAYNTSTLSETQIYNNSSSPLQSISSIKNITYSDDLNEIYFLAYTGTASTYKMARLDVATRTVYVDSSLYIGFDTIEYHNNYILCVEAVTSDNCYYIRGFNITSKNPFKLTVDPSKQLTIRGTSYNSSNGGNQNEMTKYISFGNNWDVYVNVGDSLLHKIINTDSKSSQYVSGTSHVYSGETPLSDVICYPSISAVNRISSNPVLYQYQVGSHSIVISKESLCVINWDTFNIEYQIWFFKRDIYNPSWISGGGFDELSNDSIYVYDNKIYLPYFVEIELDICNGITIKKEV